MNRFERYSKGVVWFFTVFLLTAFVAGCGTNVGQGASNSKTTGKIAAGPAPVSLGSAENYVILAKTAITTTGATSIVGNIGVSPVAASFITGFGLIADATNVFSTSSLVTGKIFASDYAVPTPATLTTAVSDMEAAYTDAAGRTTPDFTELGTGDISGMTLVPGLYKWGTGVSINSDVTLNGGPDDVWIFQVAGNLTVANAKSVILTGGALSKNIFWQVAGAATLGTTSNFKGIILSKTQVAMQTGAVLDGRALAQTQVTLDSNAVTIVAAPNVPSSIMINDGATVTSTQSVTLTLAATSATGTVTEMQFSKDGVYYYPFEPFATTRIATLLPGNGLKTMTVRFKDSTGNISDPISASITINTSPIGTIAINGGASLTGSTSATLTLSAISATGTITEMQFSKDGVNFFAFEPFATTRMVTLLPGDGLKTITVRFKDDAGNVSVSKSASINLVMAPPTETIAFTTPNPTASELGVLALTAPDGVTQMQFSKNGSGFYALEPFAASRTVTLVPGLNTLTVIFKDAAGNLSAPISTTITRN